MRKYVQENIETTQQVTNQEKFLPIGSVVTIKMLKRA